MAIKNILTEPDPFLRQKSIKVEEVNEDIRSLMNNMLETIFWILVGAFVGWHFPQPEWAKALETKVRSLFASKE